jgi:hypothetical protein
MNRFAPRGVVDSRCATLHAIQWARYLFIVSLSLPASGLYLMAMRATSVVDRIERPNTWRLRVAWAIGRPAALARRTEQRPP